MHAFNTPKHDLVINDAPISDLKPPAGHATRRPGVSKRKHLKRSLQTYGCVTPVLVDEQLRVIQGWQLVEAARELGWRTLPTLAIAALSAAQIRMLRITLNKLQEGTEWDTAALRLEFEEILSLEMDLDLTISGFEMAEIDLIFADESDEEDEPSIAEPDRDQPSIARLGDVFQCREHRILCGDARDQAAYDRLLGDERVRLTITDPPFNVAIQGHVSGKGQHHHREFVMASGEMSTDEFEAFLSEFMGLVHQHALPGALSFIFMDWRHLQSLLTVGDTVFDDLLNLCVWSKTNAGMGSLYRSQHEMVALFKSGTASHINNVQLGQFGRNRTNIWNYAGMSSFGSDRDEALAMHPTVKPVQMIADAILDVSNRNDLVLDPFLGSGTTLIACEKTHRVCRSIELDPYYVDVAIRRWQTHTGESAIHIESGLTFDELAEARTREADHVE
jgi:hypothetical protein